LVGFCFAFFVLNVYQIIYIIAGVNIMASFGSDLRKSERLYNDDKVIKFYVFFVIIYLFQKFAFVHIFPPASRDAQCASVQTNYLLLLGLL